MPQPDLRIRLPMRDGTRLDTSVWLPPGGAPAPCILQRTPYRETIVGWKQKGLLRYVEAGYTVAMQLVRGIGASEGHFAFSAPHERSDGYDTVEWLAAQPWCTGAVGMDGSSYLAMTQLYAAAARPPHLRCIVPAVGSVDFFAEAPYSGGVFWRQHALQWTLLLQLDSIAEQPAPLGALLPVMADPAQLERLTSRPLAQAADGLLQGDFLQHWRDVLAHPRLDGWWRERMLSADELAAIDLPTLVVSGNFDPCIGSLTLWRGLEARADGAARRQLLIGPWDHRQSYVGGEERHGPYDFRGGDPLIDLPALRLAFFDRHLRGRDDGARPDDRVTVFVTGSNRWHGFDRFPPPEVQDRPMWLHSQGRANSWRGDGALAPGAPLADEAPDRFASDPDALCVPTLAEAVGNPWCLHERARYHETLVYRSAPLAAPLTLLGEAWLEAVTAADVPDADLFVWLAEARASGSLLRLASGRLRLRYRDGFDREHLLEPGVPVRCRVPLTYVAHTLPVGSRLVLLVGGDDYPAFDLNPHAGTDIATETRTVPAMQTLFHDPARASCLHLPVLAGQLPQEP